MQYMIMICMVMMCMMMMFVIHPTILPQNKRLNLKVKAIPLQALTDPEGSRRLRLPDFKTVGT
jgi:hypothetical protein